jgi:hypothetical protein
MTCVTEPPAREGDRIGNSALAAESTHNEVIARNAYVGLKVNR